MKTTSVLGNHKREVIVSKDALISRVISGKTYTEIASKLGYCVERTRAIIFITARFVIEGKITSDKILIDAITREWPEK